MKRILALYFFLAPMFSTYGAIIVSDDFARANSTTLGNTSTGNFAWTEQETGGSALQISGGQLVAGSTTAGREYASVNLSSASGYSTTLANNAGVVTWTINMRETRSDPSGFGNGSYGIAFILASSSADITTGQGYAVVLGASGTPDSLRLVRFLGGLDASSDIQTTIVTGGSLNGGEYLNLRVTYDPSGNSWTLYGSSSSVGFSDPTAVNTQIGSGVNSTYTDNALNFTGVLWNHGTTTDTASFDNFSMDVVPEPEEWGAISAAGLAAIGVWHTRRRMLREQAVIPG